MCGRYTQRHSSEQIVDRFDIVHTLFEPRVSYNIAPSQVVAAVTLDDGRRTLRGLKWGLVPFWADDPDVGNRMINARAETVADKPAYRAAFSKRRCLIPADGFFEWRSHGKGKPKTPMLITVNRGDLFAFAALREHWVDDDTGEELHTFTIITTSPNNTLKPIHDRMPVILPRDDEAAWLDPDADPDDLTALLRPYPDDEAMTAVAVSRYVNKPQHNDARCVEPVDSDNADNADDATLFGNN